MVSTLQFPDGSTFIASILTLSFHFACGFSGFFPYDLENILHENFGIPFIFELVIDIYNNYKIFSPIHIEQSIESIY